MLYVVHKCACSEVAIEPMAALKWNHILVFLALNCDVSNNIERVNNDLISTISVTIFNGYLDREISAIVNFGTLQSKVNQIGYGMSKQVTLNSRYRDYVIQFVKAPGGSKFQQAALCLGIVVTFYYICS